jgi:hypothetical protein
MKQFIRECPVCESTLKITKLSCPECATEISGTFSHPPFLDLAEEDVDFLFLFLKTWGNLSEMAKIIGISYPTVRSRYEAFLKKIGIEPKSSKQDIIDTLDLLEKEEISPEEALKRIKKMK